MEKVVGHIYHIYQSVDDNGKVDGNRVLEIDVNDIGMDLMDFNGHSRIIVDHEPIEKCLLMVGILGGLIECHDEFMKDILITPTEYYERFYTNA